MTPSDPYEVLGLPPDADDAAIRRRYLELVQRHTPERDPQRFAAIRAAADELRDADTRLRRRLFGVPRFDAIDQLIEEMACRTTRRRVSLATLAAAQNVRG